MELTNARTVAMLTPFWTGHHPFTLKRFVDSFMRTNCNLWVFCPEPGEIAEWARAEYGDCSERIRVFPMDYAVNEIRRPGRIAPAVNTVKRWRKVAKRLRQATGGGRGPDLVFFLFLDAYLCPSVPGLLVDMIFPWRWSGLYYVSRPLNASQYRPQRMLRARRCCGVGILDEGGKPYVEPLLRGKAVIPFPDVPDVTPPDDSSELASEIKRRAAGRTVVGCIGSLHRRKGLMTLLHAARQLASDKFLIVAAGNVIERSFSQDELAYMMRLKEGEGDNVLLHAGAIPGDAAFNAVVKSCDILFAAYLGFPCSSGIMSQAALFHKPIIVSRGYCMEERVSKYGLGVAIEEGNVTECVAAVRQLACQDRPQDVHRDFDGYLGQHNLDQQHETLRKLLVRSGIAQE